MSQREENKIKQKCVFHREYSEEFKFIKSGKNCYEASCELCNSSFTIGSGRKSDGIWHINYEVQCFELHL